MHACMRLECVLQLSDASLTIKDNIVTYLEGVSLVILTLLLYLKGKEKGLAKVTLNYQSGSDW